MRNLNILLEYCAIVICVYIFSILSYGIIKNTRETKLQAQREFNIYMHSVLYLLHHFLYMKYIVMINNMKKGIMRINII